MIFTAYGFWLPNDPRGSWSEVVRAWELLRFGPATKVMTRRSLAPNPHNYQLRLQAKKALRYKTVEFDGKQALAIAHGFKNAIERSGFVFYACSILPEHVHLVVERHRVQHRQILNQVKGESSKALGDENLHPFQDVFLPNGKRHTPWTAKGWNVFLDTTADICRAIRYVEENPVREGLRSQTWSFVTPYKETLSRRCNATPNAALRRR
jgi:REP element-mobilizing transposase RayT